MNQTTKSYFDSHQIAINKIDFPELFKAYEELGFIYAAKKEVLQPYLKKITENWEALLGKTHELMWVLTTGNQYIGSFASVAVWKQGNFGMFSQHLVSNGNPMLSLRVLLAASLHAEFDFDAQKVKSSQNWFRPNNRYAQRILGSMYTTVGPRNASLINFNYLHLHLGNIPQTETDDYEIREIVSKDDVLNNFICDQYNDVFVRAEELDSEDLKLKNLNKHYNSFGLSRSRTILKVTERSSREIDACIIINRAPLGLNFSLLENRAYYIFSNKLDAVERASALKAINHVVKNYYQDFEPGLIPIVTDQGTSDCLRKSAALYVREYTQSIWMREGFRDWFEHISSFLNKIEQRKMRSAASC